MVGTPGVYVCSEWNVGAHGREMHKQLLNMEKPAPAQEVFKLQILGDWEAAPRGRHHEFAQIYFSNIGMNWHHPNKEKHFSYTGLLQGTKRSCYSSLKDAAHVRQLLSCLGEDITGLSMQHRWYCIIYFVILSTLHFNNTGFRKEIFIPFSECALSEVISI